MSAKRPPQAKIPTLKLTTPQGVALWPKLSEPDTTFKDEGEYQVTLVLPAEEAQPLIDKAEAHLALFIKEQSALIGKKNLAKSNFSPVKDDLDKDTEEPTGNKRLSFKMKASAISKTGKKLDFTPAVFDKFGKPTDANIGSGSLIRVNFEARPYYTPTIGAGLTFQLIAVQVLEARGKGKPGTAAECGFDVADPETQADAFADSLESAAAPNSGGDF
jgi:hypothetical protein